MKTGNVLVHTNSFWAVVIFVMASQKDASLFSYLCLLSCCLNIKYNSFAKILPTSSTNHALKNLILRFLNNIRIHPLKYSPIFLIILTGSRIHCTHGCKTFPIWYTKYSNLWFLRRSLHSYPFALLFSLFYSTGLSADWHTLGTLTPPPIRR